MSTKASTESGALFCIAAGVCEPLVADLFVWGPSVPGRALGQPVLADLFALKPKAKRLRLILGLGLSV